MPVPVCLYESIRACSAPSSPQQETTLFVTGKRASPKRFVLVWSFLSNDKPLCHIFTMTLSVARSVSLNCVRMVWMHSNSFTLSLPKARTCCKPMTSLICVKSVFQTFRSAPTQVQLVPGLTHDSSNSCRSNWSSSNSCQF